jgi:hypothetical protein
MRALMGVAVSLIIAAVGLVLALAVHPASQGAIDVNTVGWILFLVGLIGLIIDLLLWSSWGPGYMRRDATYVERGVPMYSTRRRRVVEEIDDPAAPPPL